MNVYWIGIDLGNRYTKSTSDGKQVNFNMSLVAQASELYTLPEMPDDTGIIGHLTRPFQYFVGDMADLAASDECEMVFGNERHFLDKSYKELNPAVIALIFHTIRLHIPETVKECDVILCLSVSRKEYFIDPKSMQCRFADALSRSLETAWTVQLAHGKACRVRLQKVLVKPQCELSVYAKFAISASDNGFFRFNYPLLYREHERVEKAIEQRENSLVLAQLKTRLAKKIVVYDIGSFSMQIERVSPINGVITVTKAMSPNDLGMMIMQDHFTSLLQSKFGTHKQVSKLLKHQIVRIFEEEEWDGINVSDLVNETIEQFFLRYWREFDQNVNMEDTDTIILSGQSWQKSRLLERFLERLRPLAKQHGVEIIYEPVQELGKLPALGAYALAKNWWMSQEKKKAHRVLLDRTLSADQ